MSATTAHLKTMSNVQSDNQPVRNESRLVQPCSFRVGKLGPQKRGNVEELRRTSTFFFGSRVMELEGDLYMHKLRMDKYWAAHPEEVFSPCTCEVDGALHSVNFSLFFLPHFLNVFHREDKVHFLDEQGKRVTGKGGLVTHPVAKLGELPKVHDAQLQGVGNVCELLGPMAVLIQSCSEWNVPNIEKMNNT